MEPTRTRTDMSGDEEGSGGRSGQKGPRHVRVTRDGYPSGSGPSLPLLRSRNEESSTAESTTTHGDTDVEGGLST